MAKISVFTPTQRTGMDVTHHSLRRQTGDHEIIWMMSDELYHQRWDVFRNAVAQDNFETIYFNIPKRDGYVRNLVRSYNSAMERAREEGCDLFVSLQDYIWIPDDGLDQFVQAAENFEDQKCILSGITHISSEPDEDKVYDLNGLYTIFEEAYLKKPKLLNWKDARFKPSDIDVLYRQTTPIEWETNWAAIPRAALYDERLQFDEDYDKAVAYENQDFAFQAADLGYSVVICPQNQAISLPHKKYFSQSWAFEQPLTETNRQLCEEKWGDPTQFPAQ